MSIDKDNLTNLMGLWEKYGAQYIQDTKHPKLYANTHWPYRCWLDWQGLPEKDIQQGINDFSWIDNVPEASMLPVWPLHITNKNVHTGGIDTRLVEKLLENKQWSCALEQTAMYIEVETASGCVFHERAGFQVKPVLRSEDVATWVEVASEAFGYDIDPKIIEPLVNDSDIQVLMGWLDGQAVASALLYKTGDIIGVHQVGVKKVFQGKGIAKSLMQVIIVDCSQWQGRAIVLQASPIGKPLYDSLGFKSQFMIRSYRKI